MQKVEATSILLKSFRDLTITINLSIYIMGSTLFLLFLVHLAIGSIIQSLSLLHTTFLSKQCLILFHDFMILVTWKGKLGNAWKPL
jgi:hypothetical protein